MEQVDPGVELVPLVQVRVPSSSHSLSVPLCLSLSLSLSLFLSLSLSQIRSRNTLGSTGDKILVLHCVEVCRYLKPIGVVEL